MPLGEINRAEIFRHKFVEKCEIKWNNFKAASRQKSKNIKNFWRHTILKKPIPKQPSDILCKNYIELEKKQAKWEFAQIKYTPKWLRKYEERTRSKNSKNSKTKNSSDNSKKLTKNASDVKASPMITMTLACGCSLNGKGKLTHCKQLQVDTDQGMGIIHKRFFWPKIEKI